MCSITIEVLKPHHRTTGIRDWKLQEQRFLHQCEQEFSNIKASSQQWAGQPCEPVNDDVSQAEADQETLQDSVERMLWHWKWFSVTRPCIWGQEEMARVKVALVPSSELTHCELNKYELTLSLSSLILFYTSHSMWQGNLDNPCFPILMLGPQHRCAHAQEPSHVHAQGPSHTHAVCWAWWQSSDLPQKLVNTNLVTFLTLSSWWFRIHYSLWK